MSYNDKEVSAFEGSPFFLYEFNTSSEVYRYTATPGEIEWNGETWLPLAIKHSDIKQSAEMSKNSVKLTIPQDSDLALLFKNSNPDSVVTLNIRRGQFGESDTLVYWKGKVNSHQLKEDSLQLTCESIFTSLSQSGVRTRFQRNCRHSLYGEGCGLNKDNFATGGKVTSLSGNTLTIEGAETQVDGYFDRGAIRFSDGSLRMIISHVGSTIQISRPSSYLIDEVNDSGYGVAYGSNYGGVSVTLYPGCDKTIATCRDKFNNLDNQGGFKWIPSKNPMSGSAIV